ncbi:hypothetical protein [Hwanghaeella sp.]|uniref:hypothetical protein n=1 Tax=Hwanghaeella sp. TaxID=2605943 RepID=UPI003CCBC138
MLETALSIKANTQLLGQGNNESVVRALFQGEPNYAIIANANEVGKDGEGNATQLALTLILLPDASMNMSAAEIGSWVTRWNGQQLPIKVVPQEARIAVMTSRLVDLRYPIEDQEIVTMYLFLIQTWQQMVSDLESRGLL